LRIGPRRRLKRHRSARILAAGHAFLQNLRRGHYDTVTDRHRLSTTFDNLSAAM
jgi:transposase, IS6 family